MGVLSWPVVVIPKFSVPRSGETVHQTPKVFETQECARGPLSPCQVCRGSPFTRRRGRQKRWVFCLSVCLSVCLPVTLLNVRNCAPDFAVKALEYRHGFDAVGLRLSSCAPVFSWLLPVGDITKCRSPKNGKINRSIRNLVRKRMPWRVCYCTPTLVLIGKRGSLQWPPKVKTCPKLSFLSTGSLHRERIHMKFGV